MTKNHVKGIGKASAQPDQVVLNISLESRDTYYHIAVDSSALLYRMAWVNKLDICEN
ncbi:MAG: hypothetical protein GXY06_04005 [Clostridiaceae bacterium]|nr:hypothetical protein [Clostridiaceae bacterium]